MSKTKKTAYPKELLIYVCDFENDGEPILATAKSVDEIPEDTDGEDIAVYTLNRVHKFSVKRVLT